MSTQTLQRGGHHPAETTPPRRPPSKPGPKPGPKPSQYTAEVIARGIAEKRISEGTISHGSGLAGRAPHPVRPQSKPPVSPRPLPPLGPPAPPPRQNPNTRPAPPPRRAASPSNGSPAPDGGSDAGFVLCPACSAVDLAQFHAPTSGSQNRGRSAGTTYQHKLEALLEKRNICRLCSLLFRALSRPENDPLRDAEIQQTILTDDVFMDAVKPPRPERVDFATWAETRDHFRFRRRPEAYWPFGRTKDSVEIAEARGIAASEVEFREGQGRDTNAEKQALMQGTQVGLKAGEHFDKPENSKWYKFMGDVLPSAGGFISTKNKMPAELRISVYGPGHANAGVVEVKLYGASKAIGREIKILSHFHLRVASPNVSLGPDNLLKYGRILKSGSKIDLDLCRRWLDHCRSMHCQTCSDPSWATTLQKPEGIRLIDVRNMALVTMDGARCDYAALSYVWGAAEHREGLVELTSASLHALSRPGGITPAVGRTVWDTIQVVRGLHLPYLWADRLCIAQDSDADKATQIAQMDRIYGSALLTIAAATAAHLNAGLPGIGTPRSLSQLGEQVSRSPPINILLPLEPRTDLRPWASRAWTLQEKLLSRRLLLFHHGTATFHCAAAALHEDMSAADAGRRPPAIGWIALAADARLASGLRAREHSRAAPTLLRAQVFAEYAALIAQYTPREMSHAADAVRAVAGLLGMLFAGCQGARPRPLRHGLPEEFLDQALHWLPAAGEGVRLRRREGVDIPSWSWAAWEAVVERDAAGGVVASQGGVRYEMPFAVQTDPNRGGLAKVIVQDDKGVQEERMRPLLKWNVLDEQSRSRKPPPLPPRAPTATPKAAPPLPPRRGLSPLPSTGSALLRPLNSTGRGLALEPATPPAALAAWDDAINHATKHLNGSLPPACQLPPVSGAHLVFRTSTARFRLGTTRTRTEVLWTRGAADAQGVRRLVEHSRHTLRETPVLAADGAEVGRVFLPDPEGYQRAGSAGRWYDFLLVSEAQFFGDEVDFEAGAGDYALFNVMVVEWVGGKRPFATRLAMGRVTKSGWWAGAVGEEVVVLE